MQINKKNSVSLQKIQKNTVNIRNFLDSPYTDRRENLQQNNILLIFYKIILFILNLNIFTYQVESYYIDDKNTQTGLKKDAPIFISFNKLKEDDGDDITNNIFKKSKPYMKQLIFDSKFALRKKENQKNVTDFIIFFNLSKKTCELLFKDIEKIIDLKKVSIPDADKKLLLNSTHRVSANEERVKIENLKNNAMEYFNNLFKSILPETGNLGKLESFNINNDLDKIKFIKNIQSKKDDIEKKDIMTNQKRIEFLLEKRISEIFHIRKQIFPEVVKFKYSGKSNEEENTLITDPEKLVAPSESKIFKLNQSPVPIKVTQENDYTLDENGKKKLEEKIFKITKTATDSSPGEIEVFLKFSMDVETEKTPEEILEESKKSPTIRLLQSFVSNIKNKLNCTKSKLDFYENLNQIGKMIEPVKEFTIDDDYDNNPTYDIHTKFIKTTPTTTVVTNKIISKVPIEPEKKEQLLETKTVSPEQSITKKKQSTPKKVLPSAPPMDYNSNSSTEDNIDKKKEKSSNNKLKCPHCKKTEFRNIQHYKNCVKKCERKQAESVPAVGGRKTIKLRLKKNRTLKKYN